MEAGVAIHPLDAFAIHVLAFSARTELSTRWVLEHLAIAPTQFYRWMQRYGRVNTHNGQIPRDHWVTPERARRDPRV